KHLRHACGGKSEDGVHAYFILWAITQENREDASAAGQRPVPVSCREGARLAPRRRHRARKASAKLPACKRCGRRGPCPPTSLVVAYSAVVSRQPAARRTARIQSLTEQS